jgi:hypothetical protein
MTAVFNGETEGSKSDPDSVLQPDKLSRIAVASLPIIFYRPVILDEVKDMPLIKPKPMTLPASR